MITKEYKRVLPKYTKRGNRIEYTIQKGDTRQTLGLRKHIADKKEALTSIDLNTLIVKGTMDKLGRGRWMSVKKVKIEHPIDKGFFKEAYVLNDSGRNLFRRYKRMREQGQPIFE